jgi:hypothetical protein
MSCRTLRHAPVWQAPRAVDPIFDRFLGSAR